ncbi:MAG: ABC transporter substrate-binding protein [Candidatus Rokubacteria bacterium]|nr:ABC transporter substrate-binding protein [Candidatus Rokubacteria bacterium]
MTRSARLIRVFVAVILLACACLFPPPASAGAPTDQLKAPVDEVIRILRDPRLKPDSMAAERRAAIRKEAESIFDFPETAKRALGRHWRNLSAADQREFVSLFTDLLERAYLVKIERYSGEPIVYTGDNIDGEMATVKTKFITKRGTEIPIEYRLLRHGDRWLVYDVFIEGVSLVTNYRTQFDRIIRVASYQELARRLRANQAEFSAPGGSQQGARMPRS